MIVRFDTWERASVFAAKMQSEGRHAVMLDEGVSLLWGPLAIGGVRVAVTDIVLEEDGEWPGMETVESEFAKVLRGLVTGLAISGPLLLLVHQAIEQARSPGQRSGDPVKLLVAVVVIAGVAGAFAVMGPMMPTFTRFLRDDDRLASRLVRLAVVLLFLI